jgi:hypothetical protein
MPAPAAIFSSLVIVFAQLIPWFPAMRLAVDVEELSLRRDVISGLHALPVRW